MTGEHAVLPTGASAPARRQGVLAVHPLPGVPEVTAGDDLAGLLLEAVATAGLTLEAGDCLVVSSKVVSKARGLLWAGDRADAVDAHTRRVVAERRSATGGLTRVVESLAGPVMAAAGVDASNTGPEDTVLLLPDDPDGEAAALRAALAERAGLTDAALGVVLSDTAGRPWRAGLTDFALGAAGLTVLDDLRGGVDHDGRPLAVTARAVADELAAAADLVKGKADAVPAALVRGLADTGFAADAEGAGALVRVGPGDWFARGHVEAVRAALGAAPGSTEAEEVGVRSVAPEPLRDAVARVVALALLDVPEGSADVEVRADGAEVTLAAPDRYDLGRLVVRAEVAAHAEDLTAVALTHGGDSVTLRLTQA